MMLVAQVATATGVVATTYEAAVAGAVGFWGVAALVPLETSRMKQR
jgi:hypothetical protein